LAQRRQAEHRVSSLRREQTLATDRYDRHTSLKSEHTQLQVPVQLYSFLKHPWPTSQVLNEIVSPLPDEIVLTQLTFTQQNDEGSNRPSPSNEEGESGDAGTREEKAKRDLQLLQGQAKAATTVVHLSGKSSNIAALHIYVAALNESRLIKFAKLESSQSKNALNALTELVFTVSISVERAYGLPDGLQQPRSADVALIQGGQPR